MKTPNNFEEKLIKIRDELLTKVTEGIQLGEYILEALALDDFNEAISTLCEEELLLRDLNSRIGEITRAYRFGYITKNYYERAKARNLKLYQENFKRLAELKGKE